MQCYVVIGCSGEYEDYCEEDIKGFANIKKAEELKVQLEEENETNMNMKEQCSKCNGCDKECPLYLKSEFGDECELSDMRYYENTTYKIEELEVEE